MNKITIDIRKHAVKNVLGRIIELPKDSKKDFEKQSAHEG